MGKVDTIPAAMRRLQARVDALETFLKTVYPEPKVGSPSIGLMDLVTAQAVWKAAFGEEQDDAARSGSQRGGEESGVAAGEKVEGGTSGRMR